MLSKNTSLAPSVSSWSVLISSHTGCSEACQLCFTQIIQSPPYVAGLHMQRKAALHISTAFSFPLSTLSFLCHTGQATPYSCEMQNEHPASLLTCTPTHIIPDSRSIFPKQRYTDMRAFAMSSKTPLKNTKERLKRKIGERSGKRSEETDTGDQTGTFKGTTKGTGKEDVERTAKTSAQAKVSP